MTPHDAAHIRSLIILSGPLLRWTPHDAAHIRLLNMLSRTVLRLTPQNLLMLKIVKKLARLRQVNQGTGLLSDVPPLFYMVKMTLKEN